MPAAPTPIDRDTNVVFRLPSRAATEIAARLVMFAVLTGALFALGAASAFAGTGRLRASWVGAALLVLVVVAHAANFWPCRVEVRRDGVARRWLFVRDFTPFDAVVAVRAFATPPGAYCREGVVLALRDGRRVTLGTHLHTLITFGIVGDASRLLEAIEARRAVR